MEVGDIDGVKCGVFEISIPKISSVIIIVLCIIATSESGQRAMALNKLSVPHDELMHLEKRIHDALNNERKKRGLPSLSWDEKLHRIARKYSQDMEQRNFFSHDDPDGRCFSDRYRAELFKCRIRVGNTICGGAENISLLHLNKSFYKHGKISINSDTEDEIVEEVVKGWMSSKGHRENILTSYFKRQGIGIALSREGKVYVTENFC